MAIIAPDLNPTATSNDKNVHTKIVRLTASDFTTGGTASVKAVIPADATITSMSLYTKTILSGGTISAATLSIGIPGTPTYFVNASTAAFGASGVRVGLSPISNIMQVYQLPLGSDFQILFTGTATTGNPTAGEMFVEINFVR